MSIQHNSDITAGSSSTGLFFFSAHLNDKNIYIYIYIWLNQDYFWFRGRSTFRDFNFWLRFLRGKKKTFCHWTFFLEMDFFLRLKSRVSARPHSSPSSDVGACESCLFIHSLWQRGRSTRALVLSKIWVKKNKKKKTHTEPQRLTVTQPCSRVCEALPIYF